MAQQLNEDIEDVICIHGLWMPGIEMTLLRNRLENDHGFRPHAYSYHSLSDDLDVNIERLREFVAEVSVESAHIVAHSLGGVMSLQMLRRYPDLPIDRVVCLGSPLVDSLPARMLQRYDWGRLVVGEMLIEAVLEDPLREWTGSQEVGVIAGTLGLGTGMLIAELEEPHDGVVASVETQLPGIADHIEMPVSHAGLVLSEEVTEQAAHFLRDGCFATA